MRFLLVLEDVESRRSLCLPKDTSSLEGVLLTPVGVLVQVCALPRGECLLIMVTPDGALPLCDTHTLFPQQHVESEWKDVKLRSVLYK